MTTTTEIAMNFYRRGVKTIIIKPDGSRALERKETKVDNSMVKAVARGFRWQRMILNGTYNTLYDIAEKERLSPSFVSRVTRLSTLSPRIIDAIMDGKHPPQLTMKDLLKPFPFEWTLQEQFFLHRTPAECTKRINDANVYDD